MIYVHGLQKHKKTTKSLRTACTGSRASLFYHQFIVQNMIPAYVMHIVLESNPVPFGKKSSIVPQHSVMTLPNMGGVVTLEMCYARIRAGHQITVGELAEYTDLTACKSLSYLLLYLHVPSAFYTTAEFFPMTRMAYRYYHKFSFEKLSISNVFPS